MRQAIVAVTFTSLMGGVPACSSTDPPIVPAPTAEKNPHLAATPNTPHTGTPDPTAPIVLGSALDSSPCGDCKDTELCLVRVEGGPVPPGVCQPSPCPDSELSEACARASICAGYKEVAVGVYAFSPSARRVPGIMCGCPCGDQPFDTCVCPP